jgi:hypothetical protein
MIRFPFLLISDHIVLPFISLTWFWTGRSIPWVILSFFTFLGDWHPRGLKIQVSLLLWLLTLRPAFSFFCGVRGEGRTRASLGPGLFLGSDYCFLLTGLQLVRSKIGSELSMLPLTPTCLGFIVVSPRFSYSNIGCTNTKSGVKRRLEIL